ncbi:MAG: TadE/TadG family type IV pilus assembly protein [Chloroflexales bacterium]
MFRHHRTTRSSGQALVEFALAATLILTLLSATVDLGLIFFTVQGLTAAAQEGATFGSHPVMVMNGTAIQSVDVDYAEIVNRVRYSGGPKPAGFANLLDLNNDGVLDDAASAVSGVISTPKLPSSYIYIQLLKYPNDILVDPTTGADITPGVCDTTTAGTNGDMRNAGKFCYVRVTVKYNYNFIFPFAPVFGGKIQLKSSFMIHIRSSFIG